MLGTVFFWGMIAGLSPERIQGKLLVAPYHLIVQKTELEVATQEASPSTVGIWRGCFRAMQGRGGSFVTVSGCAYFPWSEVLTYYDIWDYSEAYKITLRISVAFIHNVIFYFLSHNFSSLEKYSKESKPNKFESHDARQLTFTDVWSVI